jgi:hypothetical protein
MCIARFDFVDILCNFLYFFTHKQLDTLPFPRKTGWKITNEGFFYPLKGQCHEIFDPRFSSDNPPVGSSFTAEAVSHLASYSPRKSIRNRQNGIPQCKTPWDPTFLSSSLLIFTFSSNYMYSMCHMSVRPRDSSYVVLLNFAHDYLDFSWRIRSHIRNGFSPCIRALGGYFDEKTEGRKSHGTVLLSIPSSVAE